MKLGMPFSIPTPAWNAFAVKLMGNGSISAMPM
jgi:hypothetical protein